jgi:putative SOS response-associated peptidase YedK
MGDRGPFRPTCSVASAAVCGRFTNSRRKSDELQERLAERLGVSVPESGRGYERFNVAPTQEVLVVVEDREGRRVELLRWGLVPHWAKDPQAAYKMINARAETLSQRPAYRRLVANGEHRCLIVADGYYEWQKPEDSRQPRRPVHFSLEDGDPFCFAGLWTRWSGEDGSSVESCTIVTCEANALVRPIHHRMPVMLTEPAAWEAWLDPALDGRAASELLVPLTPELMAARPANPVVNSGRHEGSDCLVAQAA